MDARQAAGKGGVSLGSLRLNTTVLPIRGQVTACHGSPVCLDLACGRCYEPLTSIHCNCGNLSFLKCENLLSEAGLLWTCAARKRTNSEGVEHIQSQRLGFLFCRHVRIPLSESVILSGWG